MERHWLSRTSSAEYSSLSSTQVTTARTLFLALSGVRIEQAAVGLPLSELLAFMISPSRSCAGTVAHRSAGTTGSRGWTA